MSGIFYGAGVGPGDPELLTVKALRVMKQCPVIAIPVSDKNFTEAAYDPTGTDPAYKRYLEKCVAYQIAVQAGADIGQKAKLYLPMPMMKEKEQLRQVHDEGAEKTAELLEKGMDVVFITLGDPTVYSTCMYIHKRIRKQGYETRIIPGVPSFCAAAARLDQSLVENQEELHIIPASYEIEEGLKMAGTKVLMKAGRKIPYVKQVIKEQNLNLTMVENCGMENETIYHSAEEIPDEASYYSLFIVKEKNSRRGGDEMIVFVGAGPGAEDLITVRGQQYLKEADIIIYAGSLVNPGLLQVKKEGCEVYNSAYMTLEEVLEVMYAGEKEGKRIVRLHTGDPCLYGAIREQMDALEERQIPYEVCPGVSSFCGAAAALHAEYTLPDISQSVVITRMAGRTPVPDKESIRSFAEHQATMVIFLSTGMLGKLQEELMAGGYPADTPAAIVYKATWPEEKVLRCMVSELEKTAADAQVTKTALIVVGRILEGEYERSLLYHPEFTTEFRQGKQEEQADE